MDDKIFQQRQPTTALTTTDPSAIAAAEAAKARIQSAYVMAMQRPRNEAEARSRILAACKRSEFAERAQYQKPIGNTKVSGPSIRFAELALREWGNIMSEVQVLYEDDHVRRIRVSLLDLETNAQFSKDIQIKKTVERKSKKGREDDVLGERKNTYGQTVYILCATEDELFVKESANISKVIRNEGLRLIPSDIIDEGIMQARATLQSRASLDPKAELKRLCDAFSSIGVTPKNLEKYLGHSINTISPNELVDLRKVYQSIRDGESSWQDYVAEKGLFVRKDVADGPQPPDFKDCIPKGTDMEMLGKFVEISADNAGISISELEAKAVQSWDRFWSAYIVWAKKQTAGGMEPAKQDEPEPKNPTCEICGFAAKSERGLAKHMTQQHPVVETEPEQEPRTQQGQLSDDDLEDLAMELADRFEMQVGEVNRFLAWYTGNADGRMNPVQYQNLVAVGSMETEVEEWRKLDA